MDEDERLFETLDRYVQLLHAGDVASRSQLLERVPELGELLACLESLDRLAPVKQAVQENLDPDRTLVVDGSSSYGSVPNVSESFGKYQLLEEIGRGGMGVVFKARQTDLDRTVALKMILASRLASDDEVRRFYAEARAAGRLTHPNVISIHEVGAVNGQHYFAMDHVEGLSLAEQLADGPMELDEAAECLAAVARAVEYLHQQGIIHRDLKPGNILLAEDGTPYVTDFGLAKVFDGESAQTRSGAIIGTPSYMAPEQAAGRTSEISARSDVYSLGSILYEMLTGRPPFREQTPLDTLVQVLEGEPTLPGKLRTISRDLELICLRCLEKAPEDRYASAAALADDLERYLRDEPVEARPSGLGHVLRRWSRREPALLSHWAGLFVAAGVVQGNYFFDEVEWDYHLRVMSVLGVWAVVSWVFQRMLHRDELADWARFGWAAADATLLTTLLCLATGPVGPLLIGYPLLIAASGLFFKVRLVWFMTFASLVSYAVLIYLRPDEAKPPHYAVVFAGILAVFGVVVAYQVYRVRVLSRYYENRRLT